MDEQDSKRPGSWAEEEPEDRGESDGRDDGADGAHLEWLAASLLPTPVEELPTLHWPESSPQAPEADASGEGQPSTGSGNKDGARPLQDAADAMVWLEEMARGRGEPIDEMPTLITTLAGEEDEMAPHDSGAEQGADSPGAVEPDSDPMAWLEQLAVGQVSPLEELPSVADRLLASEIVSQLDEGKDGGRAPTYSAMHGPEQVEQALSYLEQLAAAQGVRWSDVPVDLSQPVGSLEEALAVIDTIALLSASSATIEVPSRPEMPLPPAEQATRVHKPASAAEGPGEIDEPTPQVKSEPPTPVPGSTAVALDEVEIAWDDLSARMPDDPREALDWLATVAEEELSSGVIIIEEEDTLPPPSPAAAESAAAEPRPSRTGDVDFALDEMPDDPDEAMAWMQRLASEREGEGGEEPSSENEVENNAPTSIAKSPLGELSADVPAPLIHPLLSARKALRKGDMEMASVLYRALVERSEETAVLIPDLEQAVAQGDPDPRFIRLLGDAYAKSGQLERALETYRRGFDQL